MKQAEYYAKHKDYIECQLCPHRCEIREGEAGLCGVRVNKYGVLTATTYGQVSAFGIDPIEKKPLFHFMPGTKIASFGSSSCNMSCQYCQNHHISQTVGFHVRTSCQELIKKSMEDSKSIGLAATYNEPTIQFEFIMDAFDLNKRCKRKNVMVTNGYIEKSPLSELVTIVDAFNVDLKGFNNDFYHKICGAKLEPVLESIGYIYDRSHLELTLLLLPGYNDDMQSLKKMFAAIRDISPDIPLHISRYYPNYQMRDPMTPLELLTMAKDWASQFLNYVYIGNVPEQLNETKCKSCGYVLVSRQGQEVRVSASDKRCPSCGRFHHLILD